MSPIAGGYSAALMHKTEAFVIFILQRAVRGGLFMNRFIKQKLFYGALLAVLSLTICAATSLAGTARLDRLTSGGISDRVEFGVTAEAMQDALSADLQGYKAGHPVSWIDILSYLGAQYGGNFSSYRKSDVAAFTDRLRAGETVEEIALKTPRFRYFKEVYSAVLGGMVGEYRRDGELRYGLRAFFPIADGYSFRPLEEKDSLAEPAFRSRCLSGEIGTPVIAVESGRVETIGWNQYGGWRIAIRSFDNKRCYYYAHLRKDHPFPALKEGDVVTAGDVIGYLGMTGMSVRENVDNLDFPQLRFGITLSFNAYQREGSEQLPIDPLEVLRFLSQNRMTVVMDPVAGEYRPAAGIGLSFLPV